jgi:ABC-type multidrug transport system fused ATPase/permease subunit
VSADRIGKIYEFIPDKDVPPADYLFSGTVVDNIVMSDEEIRLDDLRKAMIDAGIFEYIQSLPEGIDSVIGEGGRTVSSEQAQRIAIARALYKRSPIIVFDEPTANLDVESIAKFHSTVKKLAKDKICIIVTCDISTMDICDKVYILEDGNLAEKCCYELIRLN